MNHRLSLESIQRATTLIDPVFLNSPQFVAEGLSDVLKVRVVVKVETLNPIRSFKGRGADYFVRRTLESGFAGEFYCASAGNFGQALAYACRSRGGRLTVYASVNANPFKIERMRALGANVILHGEDFDAAKLEAKRAAGAAGAFMVEDGLEPLISEGAGTMAVELAGFAEALDAVLVPLGNGAMTGGVGRWFKHASPKTRVVAVQASGAPAMLESWRSGTVVEHDRIATIADGIGVRVPIREALDDMRDLVDDGLLVSDETILTAIKLAHQSLGVVLEPSGAVGLAALLEADFSGQTVGVILCGGNLTGEQMRAWL
jgi:threonine dehydratase